MCFLQQTSNYLCSYYLLNQKSLIYLPHKIPHCQHLHLKCHLYKNHKPSHKMLENLHSHSLLQHKKKMSHTFSRFTPSSSVSQSTNSMPNFKPPNNATCGISLKSSNQGISDSTSKCRELHSSRPPKVARQEHDKEVVYNDQLVRHFSQSKTTPTHALMDIIEDNNVNKNKEDATSQVCKGNSYQHALNKVAWTDDYHVDIDDVLEMEEFQEIDRPKLGIMEGPLQACNVWLLDIGTKIRVHLMNLIN